MIWGRGLMVCASWPTAFYTAACGVTAKDVLTLTVSPVLCSYAMRCMQVLRSQTSEPQAVRKRAAAHSSAENMCRRPSTLHWQLHITS